MPSSATAAVALGSAPPLDRAEWGADQKDGQNNQWRKDQSENKGHKEPATAVDTADRSQGADDHVKYHFEHGPALINSPFRASLEATPMSEARVVQEPAGAPAFSACSAAFGFPDRESHICF
jgi:hypothetical protein